MTFSIPVDTPPGLRSTLQDIGSKLNALLTQNIPLQGRRIVSAGDAIDFADYVTKRQMNRAIANALVEAAVSDEVSIRLVVKFGTIANRPSVAPSINMLYFATDYDYVAFLSIGTAWRYAGGTMRDTFANRPATLGVNDEGFRFEATDTEQVYAWTGAAWDQQLAPALLPFLGLTSSFPALKRSAAILQARLADDSAYTDIEVAGEAYDATNWDGSFEVTTKNDVRDKFESLPALAAGVYTPVLTNVANLDGSASFEAQYMRVGATVSVSGKVTVDPTAAATPTQLGISLPVVSNIGAVEDVGGVAFAQGIAGQGAAIIGDAANNRAQMEWISGDVTSQSMSFVFQYQVI